MRRLKDYSLKDWGRARPFLHGLKSMHYARRTRRFVAQPSADSAEVLSRIGAKADDRPLLATIAFEAPWATDWQIRAMARWMPGSRHLVADNSRDDHQADRIRAVCRSHGTPYLRLPPNPEHNPSRSHGMALNWVFANIVRPTAPAVFGVLDHDLIPFRPADIPKVLARQPVYGQLHRREWGWYPWAGYCFFDLNAFRDDAFDFAPDWFYVLDTGGRNYRSFLHRLESQKMAWAHVAWGSLRRRDEIVATGILVIDNFFHLGNASLYDVAEADRIAALEANSQADDIEVVLDA